MIKLNPNSNLWKYFLWLEANKEKFHSWHISRAIESGKTDLCYFARTLSIYSIFLPLMQILTILSPLIVFVFYPLYHMGGEYITSVYHIGFLYGVICLVLGLIHFGTKSKNEETGSTKEKQPSVFKLIKTYLRSKKEKYCPLIITDESVDIS